MARELFLRIDEQKYKYLYTYPCNTLQIFITNRCNLRCKACFNEKNLGTGDMSFDEYQNIVQFYHKDISKIILLGGEPTMHDEIEHMIEYNQQYGLKTTIYTNGWNLNRFSNISFENVDVRLGVYGYETTEKPLLPILDKYSNIDIPITLAFMMRKDNVDELYKVSTAANSLKCENLFISSIRDISKTGNYWVDSKETIPLPDYFSNVQSFLDSYKEKMTLHIARRGIIVTKFDKDQIMVDCCRFGNIFPDGKIITCPFDVSLNRVNQAVLFGKKCNKSTTCLLQKIRLQVINQEAGKTAP